MTSHTPAIDAAVEPDTTTPRRTATEIRDELVTTVITYAENEALTLTAAVQAGIRMGIDTDRRESAAALNTLIDAAAKWCLELHHYVIPSASESSAEDAASYTAQAERIEQALAHFTPAEENPS